MKKCVLGAALAIASAAACAATAEFASKEDAVAMVKKGVALVKSAGKDKAFAEFNKKDGTFVDRDLYLFAMNTEGQYFAHGTNEKLVGRNLIELKDADGKELVREMADSGKTKSGYWVAYRWTNPVSKKIEPKETYCERAQEFVICGGVYVKN